MNCISIYAWKWVHLFSLGCYCGMLGHSTQSRAGLGLCCCYGFTHTYLRLHISLVLPLFTVRSHSSVDFLNVFCSTFFSNSPSLPILQSGFFLHSCLSDRSGLLLLVFGVLLSEAGEVFFVLLVENHEVMENDRYGTNYPPSLQFLDIPFLSPTLEL